jgi:hypothetical protein
MNELMNEHYVLVLLSIEVIRSHFDVALTVLKSEYFAVVT